MGSEDFLERFDGHPGVDPCRDIGVRIGPGLRLLDGVELGDHDAAAEAGRARVLGIDRRARAGQQQPAQAQGMFNRPAPASNNNDDDIYN